MLVCTTYTDSVASLKHVGKCFFGQQLCSGPSDGCTQRAKPPNSVQRGGKQSGNTNVYNLLSLVSMTTGGGLWLIYHSMLFVRQGLRNDFVRNIMWTFEDIHMLVGSNMPIFGGGRYPAVSLRLRWEFVCSDPGSEINVHLERK